MLPGIDFIFGIKQAEETTDSLLLGDALFGTRK